jgi:hypothetical protein
MEMAREDILEPFFLAFTVLDVRTPRDGSLVPSDLDSPEGNDRKYMN